jgi:HEAT repeat protein
MNEELKAFLTLLADEDEPIPVEQLSALSDLNREDLKSFSEVWVSLSDSRRQDLIRKLGQEAFNRIELLFEAINRMALDDPDADVRRMAIDNLWECEDSKLIPSLLKALEKDQDELVRAAAAKALGRFVLMGQMEQISLASLARIEKMLFRAHAEDHAKAVRLAALESIGFSSHDDISPVISQAYQQGGDDLKLSAIKAMGRTANAVWTEQVIESLYHKSPYIRSEAATAAGELELKASVDNLIELLDDAHPQVVQAAVWALGHVGGKKAEESLIAFSEINEDPTLQVYIHEALEYLDFVNGLLDFSIFEFDDDPEAPTIE